MQGDGFRESGFSKERRLEPQITIGLLTGADGFPLMVSAFEGNRAETRTMLPVIESFMAAHQLPGRDRRRRCRGWCRRRTRSRSRPRACRSSSARRSRTSPTWSRSGAASTPARRSRDGHVFTQPWPAGPDGGRRDQVIYYQYKADRARRTLRGIDEQVRKAEQAVAGKTPVKRNRFVRLSGGTRTVNRELEDKARALAGLKGYVTNLRACPDGTPVTRGVRDRRLPPAVPDREVDSGWPRATCRPGRSTTANATRSKPTSRSCSPPWRSAAGSSTTTGWSIRKFVKTARRYRTIQIQAGDHVITAADPLPDDLRQAIEAINGSR